MSIQNKNTSTLTIQLFYFYSHSVLQLISLQHVIVLCQIPLVPVGSY